MGMGICSRHDDMKVTVSISTDSGLGLDAAMAYLPWRGTSRCRQKPTKVSADTALSDATMPRFINVATMRPYIAFPADPENQDDALTRGASISTWFATLHTPRAIVDSDVLVSAWPLNNFDTGTSPSAIYWCTQDGLHRQPHRLAVQGKMHCARTHPDFGE